MFNDNGSFLLALFEFFIFFAWIMCVFYVFADIFRSQDMGGAAKTVWCLLSSSCHSWASSSTSSHAAAACRSVPWRSSRRCGDSRMSMCVQWSPQAVAARVPIRSRRPNNSSTRGRSPRPSSTS